MVDVIYNVVFNEKAYLFGRWSRHNFICKSYEIVESLGYKKIIFYEVVNNTEYSYSASYQSLYHHNNTIQYSYSDDGILEKTCAQLTKYEYIMYTNLSNDFNNLITISTYTGNIKITDGRSKEEIFDEILNLKLEHLGILENKKSLEPETKKPWWKLW